MKLLLRILLVGLGCLAATASAASYRVSTSKAIRIALVDTQAGQADARRLEEAFAPRFEAAVGMIYGAETPVEFIRVGADMAADGLRRGVYDASLVFSPRLPAQIKRTGCHALRAIAGEEREGQVAFLVLRREQPTLDDLLANAFSATVNHGDVQRLLLERRNPLLVATR